MRQYPANLLSTGEEVRFQLRPHFRALLLPGIVLVVTVGIFILAAIAVADTIFFWPLVVIACLILFFGSVRPFLRWVTTQYVFTSRRVITRKGIINRQGRDMPLAKVNNVSFDIPALGRVLNYGTLKIESAADNDGDLIIADVPDVQHVQRAVYELYEQDDARRRAGGGWVDAGAL